MPVRRIVVIPPAECATMTTTPADEPDEYELVMPDRVDPADRFNAPKALPIAYPAKPRIERAVRGVLVFLAALFVVVLGAAATIEPYDAEGKPKTMATHTQLGLPPCNAMQYFGKPCPACGMTTSFALFMHADPIAAARANWVGLLLAAFCAFGVPWTIASAIRGRYYIIGNLERTSTIVVTILLVTMIGRWIVVILTD